MGGALVSFEFEKMFYQSLTKRLKIHSRHMPRRVQSFVVLFAYIRCLVKKSITNFGQSSSLCTRIYDITTLQFSNNSIIFNNQSQK